MNLPPLGVLETCGGNYGWIPAFFFLQKKAQSSQHWQKISLESFNGICSNQKNPKPYLLLLTSIRKKFKKVQRFVDVSNWSCWKVHFFENHLAEEIFVLDASNWLKLVASVFLNYLPDFYLITNKFGGCRASPLNGEKEIYGTL